MNHKTDLQHKLTTQYLNPNEIAALLWTNRDRVNRLLTWDFRTWCEKKELKKWSYWYRIKLLVIGEFIGLFKDSIEKLSQPSWKVVSIEKKKAEWLMWMQEAISKWILNRNEWHYLKQHYLKEFFKRENPNASSSPYCLIREKITDCKQLLGQLRVEKPEISQGSSRNTIRFR